MKEAKGTHQSCRDNPNAPRLPTTKIPQPPKEMNALQKSVWRELAAQVDALGIFNASSITAFRLLVETVAETRAPDLASQPPTYRSRSRQTAVSLLQHFGLTPATQDKVASTNAKSEDKEADFLFGQNGLEVVPGGKGA